MNDPYRALSAVEYLVGLILFALCVLVVVAGVSPVAAAPSSMTGDISHMGPGYPDRYLALPVKPFVTVELCGSAECVIMAQNDYGPDRGIFPDRIADVSPVMFERLCGCPSSTGIIHGRWTVVGGKLPATDATSNASYGLALVVIGLTLVGLAWALWERRSRG